MSGKCPSCGQSISSVRIESVDVKQGMKPLWAGVSYVCPNVACQVVLGVSIDPVAIKTDIVNEVLQGLKRP